MKAVALMLALAAAATAEVERYKDEAAYLARLAELGLEVVGEGFEGAAWDAFRSDSGTHHWATTVTSQGLTWDSAAQDLWQNGAARITTNGNWARSGDWGLYDNYLASSVRVTSPTAIHAIGFWVNTNPDLDDVGVLFPDRDTANEPGYVLDGFGAVYPGDIAPVGHAFAGFIDPSGFTTVIISGVLQINEEDQLEGAVVYGLDDVTFGMPASASPLEAWRAEHFAPADLGDPSKEATVWGTAADPDGDRLTNDAEFGLGTDPTDPGSRAMIEAVAQSVGGETRVRLTFLRRNDDPGLTLTPQRSADLVTWDSGPAAFETVATIDQGDGYDLLTVRTLASGAPSSGVFARVAILRSDP